MDFYIDTSNFLQNRWLRLNKKKTQIKKPFSQIWILKNERLYIFSKKSSFKTYRSHEEKQK